LHDHLRLELPTVLSASRHRSSPPQPRRIVELAYPVVQETGAITARPHPALHRRLDHPVLTCSPPPQSAISLHPRLLRSDRSVPAASARTRNGTTERSLSAHLMPFSAQRPASVGVQRNSRQHISGRCR
jgi:hypothetical protein